MHATIDRLAAASAFAGCNPADIRAFVETAAELRIVGPQELIVRAGAEPDALWFLLDGEVEKLEQTASEAERVIARLSGVRVLNELALFEHEACATTLRTRSPCRLLRVPIDRLDDSPIAMQLRSNLARELTRDLARRLAAAQQAQVDESKRRSAIGEYMVRIFSICAFYMFVMSEVTSAWAFGPQYSFFLAFVLVLFAGSVALFIKTDALPRAIFGLSLTNWRRVSLEAVLWSVPLMAAIVVVKATLIHTVPRFADVPLFDFGAPWRPNLGYFILVEGVYTVLVPVQQFITRSGMQAPFEHLLPSRYGRAQAIVLSSVLFSAMHLHFGPIFAIAVLPVGVYWGWMFARQRSLLGVSLSHILVGNFAFAVTGVGGIIP